MGNASRMQQSIWSFVYKTFLKVFKILILNWESHFDPCLILEESPVVGISRMKVLNYGLHKSRKSLNLPCHYCLFMCLSVHRRARACPAVPWHSQLPIQAWFATGSAIDVPGETWLGSVLLQGSTTRAQRPDTQKSASVHRHESYRPQPGAANSCSKSDKNRISSPTTMTHHCWYPTFITIYILRILHTVECRGVFNRFHLHF